MSFPVALVIALPGFSDAKQVWNFQNGNCLHELEAVGEAEVTGVSSFRENTVIAVGWSRKIVLYDDSDADVSGL